MIHWTDVRMYLRGRKVPSRLGGLARANMLRAWADGERGGYVTRVTDSDGRDLHARDIDWTGADEAPARRKPGRPVTTGRGSTKGRQVIVRLSTEEHDRISAQATRDGCESVAEWMREIAIANCVG